MVGVAVAHHSYNNDKKNLGSKRKQSLVICPSSIVGHWINETLKLSPMFNSLQYTGPPKKRKQLQKNFDDHDIIITRYGQIPRLISISAHEVMAPHLFIILSCVLIYQLSNFEIGFVRVENEDMDVHSIGRRSLIKKS